MSAAGDELPESEALPVSEEVILRVPAKADYIALVRVVLAAAAAIDPDSRDDRVDDLRIAVSEAVTNAVEAHKAGGTDSHIEVRCFTSGHQVEVTVRDRGPGFDPDSVEAAPTLKIPSACSGRVAWGSRSCESSSIEPISKPVMTEPSFAW